MKTPIATKLAITDSQTRLTPSEVVFLNAQAFAAKGDLSLRHAPDKVSGQQLGQVMLSAALLAAEQVGTIHLALRPVKGLLKRETLTLFVTPLEVRHPWPADTLEARFQALLNTSVAKTGLCQVDRLIYDLFDPDSPAPWQQVVDLVENGLVNRGLLAGEGPKRFLNLTRRRYELPVKTQFLLNRQPPELIKRLLAQCREDQPALWQHLLAQITRGLNRSTPSLV